MSPESKGSRELREIHTLPQLIKYLRVELGWPIETDSFSDLDDFTFDWGAEELGIDPDSAAKIEYIKQLRPLEKGQPQGVFFIKFDTRKLPVVALRRVLSRLVVRKRATAAAAERPLWQMRDLVFISSYGDSEERQLSFAYFQDAEHRQDLPTLKVLGWDNRDTPLHLDNADGKLRAHLSWPASSTKLAQWRQEWSNAFQLRHGEVVTTSKDLSIRLAELARAIRNRIKTALAIESDKGPLTKLMKAFQQALVHDLNADGFADMYAQTIAYGLLSARIADPHKKTADDFAAHMRTSPFLRELMETFLKVGGRRGRAGGPGIDFDELGVSEVVELLDGADMEAVVRDFGNRNQQEDPVMHFYELFLHEYDRQLKVQRGVFYTPHPVVSYIVRSVHELLQTEFGLADGLADTTTWGEMIEKRRGLALPMLEDDVGREYPISRDEPFVQILDPATGTATFLVEIIDVIHRTLTEKWTQQRHTDAEQRAAWNDYVPQHLLPRLHAFELMMAPYAIAHMKIGLKLAETGYRFGTEERARIYLTNALEPWQRQLRLPEFDALAHEAAAVNEIKRHKRFTVVIGNPPYSVSSTNRSDFIEALLIDYKAAVRSERNLQPLSDDYVKFIRFAQSLICNTGCGILGFITNHAYLFGLIHRGMREELKCALQTLRLLDLHGNTTTGELNGLGMRDENVFDIQQGVAIAVGAKSINAPESSVTFAELIGSREIKNSALLGEGDHISFRALAPEPPYFFFRPKDFTHKAEYEQGVPVSELLSEHKMGIQFGHVDFVTDIDRDELVARVRCFFDPKWKDADLESAFGLKDMAGWTLSRERQKAFKEGFNNALVCKVDVRPLDVRWTYFSKRVLKRPVVEVMGHLMRKNLALIGVRHIRADEYAHFLATNHLVGKDAISMTDMCFVFPLYLYPESDGLVFDQKRRPNLNSQLLSPWLNRLGISPSWLATNYSNSEIGTPEDIFQYAYAVFHSPSYRSRYAEFLKIDFPRLPLTGNLGLFRALTRIGDELTALHLLESPKLDKPTTEFLGSRNHEVEKVSWSADTVWVNKAQTTGFKGVLESVWNFHIGGYQVCEKWLKDRKGRKLSQNDLAHYQKIVVALSETIRLMKEIDEVIEQHGGWPGAFQPKAANAATPKVVPFTPRKVTPKPEERYKSCAPLVPLKAAASAFSDPQLVPDDDFEWVAIESKHRLHPGMFVAEVVGKSMEPTIPDGAYCLFRAPVEGTRQGKTVLVQLRDAKDPESRQQYTVKRYESEKAKRGDSWRHTKITLKPLNPDFEPIVFLDAEEGALTVIAEFVEVLPSGT